MKFIFIILAFVLFSGALHAEFRTWTRNNGNVAELELVGTKGSGDVLEAIFMMRNGSKVDFPVADLIAADAELVREWEPAKEKATSVYDEYLDKNLLKLNGDSFRSYEMEKKPTKYYLFYYCASWFSPCDPFSDALVKFYDAHKPKSDEFEIILISADYEEEKMEKFAAKKKMNWPHLKFNKTSGFKKKFKHRSSKIPILVLTDLNGELIKSNYGREIYDGPEIVTDHLKELLSQPKASAPE